VLGVVLAGAIGPVDANDVLTELIDAVQDFTDPVDEAFCREFQLSTLERHLPDGQLDLFVAESLKLPARVWRDVGLGFPRDGVYEDAAAIGVPALLVRGELDPIATGAEQEQLLEALPEGRLEVYEGSGHAVHWEQPERFAADVTAFTREVSRA
jgi:non-heme chloroperoxidase